MPFGKCTRNAEDAAAGSGVTRTGAGAVLIGRPLLRSQATVVIARHLKTSKPPPGIATIPFEPTIDQYDVNGIEEPRLQHHSILIGKQLAFYL